MKTMENIRVGLLDFGLRDNKMNSLHVVEDLIEYAGNADKLGFSRFWVAEHHVSSPRAAWSNPETLLPILAGMTNRIKIGVAGILLSIHNPYHIALNFKLLANLFPGRIDLGLANGVVGENVSQAATKDTNQVLRASFNPKLEELVHYLYDEDEVFNEGKGIVIPPYKGEIPEVWTLGVSYGSLDRALKLRTSFARSIFHSGSDVSYEKEKLAQFREEYFQKHGKQPNMTLALAGCCHKTSQKAKKILDYLNNKTAVGKGDIFGSPAKFYDEIMAMKEQYGIDEIIFMSAAMESKDRMTGIELISDIFKLNQN
jgi:luciferase family oxidoreductase group 1